MLISVTGEQQGGRGAERIGLMRDSEWTWVSTVHGAKGVLGMP